MLTKLISKPWHLCRPFAFTQLGFIVNCLERQFSRERSGSICWFTYRMAAVLRAELIRIWELCSCSGSPMWVPVEPSSAILLGHKQSAGLEVEQLRHEPRNLWDTSAVSWRISPVAAAVLSYLIPSLVLLIRKIFPPSSQWKDWQFFLFTAHQVSFLAPVLGLILGRCFCCIPFLFAQNLICWCVIMCYMRQIISCFLSLGTSLTLFLQTQRWMFLGKVCVLSKWLLLKMCPVHLCLRNLHCCYVRGWAPVQTFENVIVEQNVFHSYYVN